MSELPAGREASEDSGERLTAGRLRSLAAFSQIASSAFQGNPREQIYENRVPNKSPNKRQLSAAEERLVITVNYFISADLEPGLNQITHF